MQIIETLLTITVLVILAEVSYLVVKYQKKMRHAVRLVQYFSIRLFSSTEELWQLLNLVLYGDTLVIPRSVIGELQFFADNADHDKRARARYGLDIVSDLQAMPEVTVEVLQDGSKADEGVDERLLTLAKKHRAVYLYS